MAILGNLEVTISSGGNTLQEYDVDPGEVANIMSDSSIQPAATIVKYIEAIPGAEFQINSKITKRQDFGKADYLIFYTCVDGQKITSPVITGEKLDEQGCFAYTREGALSCEGAVWKMNPFRWKELSITDKPSIGSKANIMETYAQIGIIKVRFCRERIIIKNHQLSGVTFSNEPIPEKALKGRAVDVGAGLGQARPAKFRDIIKGECIDKGPLAEFIFLYRSKHALQILDVLPQTPPPQPLEDKATDSLTFEEARTLVDRQKAGLEAASLEIETLKAQKEKAERKLGNIVRSLAGVDDVDETGPSSNSKPEAPGQSDAGERLHNAGPPRKRVKRESDIIDLSD
ncbi:hypothetical protein LTR47_009830 [Exophiala xenobiotica]|nr:hypothetical protein LTR41_001457 [Exophiala xenobiotica]KAK5224219.1 hypothetical protein LTR47_009830 [Exophiala xenobiotica]KAK5242014.1 hypothetical protein LTS06_011784 [Exophiala xenobiotica]KAK5279879.1 hypothetical protein LTR40_007153 [Exophiala xenobiotica]KAK5317389.1 hypothetical protein LTR93_008600 [Exophiala xenobiotica]